MAKKPPASAAKIVASARTAGARLFDHVRADFGELCKDAEGEPAMLLRRICDRRIELQVEAMAFPDQSKDIKERMEFEYASLGNLANVEAQAVVQSVERNLRTIVGVGLDLLFKAAVAV